MTVEVGSKLKGKISSITNFGAFVDLNNNKIGLVHISEVSNNYIKDIHDVLKIGDEVTVKVLKIDDNGRISLSIKQALSDNKHLDYVKNGRNKFHSAEHSSQTKRSKKDFDALLAGFLKESDERLTSLKRNTDGKRGGRGGRRS